VITASNGKIYVIGAGAAGPVYQYDPVTDTWAQKASMPVGVGDGAISLDANGNIVVIGGYGWPPNAYYSNVVESYNPSTDTWTLETPFPYGIVSVRAALGNDGNIYLSST
jgi:hypothetical protein